MTRLSVRLCLTVCATAGLALAACASSAPTNPPPAAAPPTATAGAAGAGDSSTLSATDVGVTKDTILLGGTAPLSGPAAAYGALARASDAYGSVSLNPDGGVAADQSTITVDLTSLTSDEFMRDNFIKRNTLQISQFLAAIFVSNQVQGLSSLPISGQATFQLLGNLTIHGVTQPATWQVSATFDGGTASGTATTPIQLTDFGMTPPRVGPVLSIENVVTLQLDFLATSQT